MNNGVIQILLDAQQEIAFREVLEDQKLSGGYIFALVSRSFEPSEGKSVLRFQSKRVSKKTAARITKIIREEKL